jgi:hypothetical protein
MSGTEIVVAEATPQPAVNPNATPTPVVKPTALQLLIEAGVEVDFKSVMSALKKASSGDSSGLVISVREIRSYIQHSGKKVARGADNLLAIGLNVAVMKVLYAALSGTGERINLKDSLRIVRDQFGVVFTEEQIEVLELGFG